MLVLGPFERASGVLCCLCSALGHHIRVTKVALDIVATCADLRGAWERLHCVMSLVAIMLGWGPLARGTEHE